MKMLKVKISGSYKTVDNKPVDFFDVVGYMPECEEDIMEAAALTRYAVMWIEADKNYPSRAEMITRCYVDEFSISEKKASFDGKEFKAMQWDELQDAAVAKGLRAVPIYKSCGLREAQIKSYIAYVTKYEGDIVDADLKVSQMKEIKISAKANSQREPANEVDPEELFALSAEKAVVTLAQLKVQADAQGIKYPENVIYDVLYKKVFPKV